MVKSCSDSYHTQFSAFPDMLSYHEKFLTDSRWERSEVHGTRILEVLLDWIVSPAVLIYAAILYLYAFKFLVTWSLPEGGVAYLVFGFTSVAQAEKA